MIRVANYKNRGSQRFKMAVIFTGDELEQASSILKDERLRCSVHDHQIIITIDRSSGYRLGKYEPKAKRRVLGILHNHKSLGVFGAVDAADWKFGADRLTIDLPEELHQPLKRTKPRKKASPPPTITLRQAVEAVNGHKDILGDDLCLSIERGRLRALIEY